MVETLGSQLRQARLRRQISLEDAAHGTKVRAARLADLENDVYTNFPNIAYARGFLVIYGKFLDVDTTPYLGAFDDTNTFGLDDYQYLSEQPVAQYRAERHEPLRPFRPRRGERRRLPVRAPAVVAVMVALGLAVWWGTMRFRQLGSLDQLATRQEGRDAPAASPSPLLPVPAAEPVSSWSLADITPGAGAETAAASATPGLPLAAASLQPLPAFGNPAEEPPPPPPAPAVPAPKPAKEVIIKPLRKTRVTVVVDNPTARPAFEDWLGPGARPLSFRGEKFFLHVRDRGSVVISKDGVVQTQTGTDIYIE